MPGRLSPRVAGAGLALLLMLTAAPALPVAGAAASMQQPNIVVVMTDDQRWDTLWAMPFVNGKLRRESVEFPYTYVTTPTCCPSRAGFLAGGYYAHNTGVLTNDAPNGSVLAFDETRTLPVKLQRAGYRTAIIGKYLNGYFEVAPNVPPGWDRFVASLTGDDFVDFEIVRGSSGPDAATIGEIERHEDSYVTTFQIDEALSFVSEPGDRPFFLLLSLNAPHPPATPAAEDEELFSDYVYRDRAWGEARLNDKPLWVRGRAAGFPDQRANADELHRDQLRTLQSVDRGLRSLWGTLEASGQAANTVWVFTSDNGYLWGEHRLFGKALPYEEALRVPLLVSIPGVPAGVDPHVVAMNLDIPATIFELSGLYTTDKQLARNSDGASLMPLLLGKEVADWRTDLLIESYGNIFAILLDFAEPELGRDVPWSWKLIDYDASGFEAYDGEVDPFELENANLTRYFRQQVRPDMSARLNALKGLAILSGTLPDAVAGRPYDEAIPAWGGTEPYTWTMYEGPDSGPPDGDESSVPDESTATAIPSIPEGLVLGGRGRVTGTPTTPGDYVFRVRVTDSSVARYSNKPQTYVREMTLTVR